MVNYNSGISGVVFVSILLLFFSLNTGSTVPNNMICIWTGQSNSSWFKFNRYLREEFRSLNSAFRALLANDHSGIFLLQWIMNWTCLSIHSRGFLEADYSRPLIPELNIIGIYLRIKKQMMSTFIYLKLDHWIMQFKSFHRISHYGLWVILPCASMKTNQTGSVLVHCNVSFVHAK